MLNALKIKNPIVWVSLFFLLGTQARAQETKVKVNLQIGVSVSKYAVVSQSQFSQYKGPYSAAPSFFMGASIDVPVIKTWSLSTGLKVIGKAVNPKGDPILAFQDKGYKEAYYLELPVMVVKNFSIGKTNFFLGAGAYASLLISGNEHIEWNAYNTNPDVPSSGEFDLFHKKDAGLIFNAGVWVSTKLSLTAGYEMGLSNMLNNQMEGIVPKKTELENRTITVGLQIRL